MKWHTKVNKIPSITETMKEMNGKKIQVGVFEGEHQWLAGIHEYGCDIKAKNVKYLTVPIHPKAKDKKASEFKDLFRIKTKDGNLFLARNIKRGKYKGETEFLYWLTERVTIPERSFLRAGHDDVIKDIMKYNDRLLKQVAIGKMSADDYLKAIGQQLSTQIKRYARDLDDPPNAKITQNVKGDNNPLIGHKTGGMIASITWRVED